MLEIMSPLVLLVLFSIASDSVLAQFDQSSIWEAVLLQANQFESTSTPTTAKEREECGTVPFFLLWRRVI